MNQNRNTDIAIIGAAGRFPGAESVDALWQVLLSGQEPFVLLDDAQLEAVGHGELARSPRYVRQARIPTHYDCFDAAFFGYSPREAAFMDPQQRLLLECAWHVFEHAGHVPEDADGMRTTVFASVGMNGYSALHALPQALAGNADMFDCIIGNDKDYSATRIAYKLNLGGAAVNVQTACSSSLVAVHLAVQSLLGFEADRALVAAATLSVPAEAGYLAEESGIRSPDGHCRPFDAMSNGTVFGSGVAAVLLRRLDDAIATGDRILAVIRSSAANNDAGSRVGFTAPGLRGQVEVISEALQVARADAAELSYVECHGTGTHLGDPIEVAALDQAIRANSANELPPHHCLIGSIKGNIGHLDTVAGLAGLIKTALCLQQKEIPATLHFSRPNPQIHIESTPFKVADRCQPWPADRPLLAGVSAFGFGGTNAHLILAGAPQPLPTGPVREWHCLPLSAADEIALERQAAALADWIEQHPDIALADIGYTLQVGRSALPWRAIALAGDRAEAIAAFRGMRAIQSRPSAGTLWIFPGQGTQYPGMAAAHYDAEPLFRDALDEVLDQLPKTTDLDTIRALLLNGNYSAGDDTAIVQPALFSYQVALGRTLLALGMTPSSLLGHSLGELSAACLAGVFQLREAAELVCTRGTLMAETEKGSMAVLQTDVGNVRVLLSERYPQLDLAVVNSPTCCVVGGPPASVDKLLADAFASNWQPRRLRTSHAFHTRMMDPVLERFRRLLQGLSPAAPRWPLLSGQDGQWLSPERATDPEYWVQQLRDPVRFDAAWKRISPFAHTLLEVGPPGGLLTFAHDAGCRGATMMTLSGDRHQHQPARQARFLHTLLRLWQQGEALDWGAFNQHWLPRRKVSLPPYPFARERHWLPSSLPLLQAVQQGQVDSLPVFSPARPQTNTSAPLNQAGIQLQARPRLDTPYTAPASELEREMTSIWQSLLFIAEIGRHDDFFALGGNSILALRLCQQVRSLGWVLTPQQVFQQRDIASLCANLSVPLAEPEPTSTVAVDLAPEDTESLLQLLDGADLK
ncbi:acyltransferase domain-containing protein [Verminephrobacter aporrectodeae subsp. tuberculatae]|uniref:type I polyketide synthase n=1 Tax=Verminephrobacter aporrectodeae TaxID=1110389 RepID=UPI00223808CF|nr:type I polyketide synthase [Verminephrobacter aporrectodeae]MCW5258060.1 acyltransferase domain-containing protein [Verminephrobacter aporrectodeae subsp. tuberculatae]